MSDDHHRRDDERDEEDEGILYVGGDYDPRDVDLGSHEFYAYSETDYVDTTGPSNGTANEKTVFESAEYPRQRMSEPVDPKNTQPDPTRRKEAILQDIRDRFEQDESLMAHPIKVTVNNSGEVTLEGVVESPDSWSRYEAAVRDVPGVTKITNWLRIQPSEKP